MIFFLQFWVQRGDYVPGGGGILSYTHYSTSSVQAKGLRLVHVVVRNLLPNIEQLWAILTCNLIDVPSLNEIFLNE